MSAFVASSAIVLPALLALAPTAISAQDAPPDAPKATGHSFVTDARGLELGASSGILFVFLTFGGHVSLPVTPGLNLEVSSEVAPWVIDFGEGIELVLGTHIEYVGRSVAAVRGSQRSLIVGVSAFTVGERRRAPHGRDTWDFHTTLRPHGGISWQWWQGPHRDVRLDVLGVGILGAGATRLGLDGLASAAGRVMSPRNVAAVLVATVLAVACAAQAHGQPVLPHGRPGTNRPAAVRDWRRWRRERHEPRRRHAGVAAARQPAVVRHRRQLSREGGNSPAFGLGQAQLRIPFRARLRLRDSLLVGANGTSRPSIPRQGDSPPALAGRPAPSRRRQHAVADRQWDRPARGRAARRPVRRAHPRGAAGRRRSRLACEPAAVRGAPTGGTP